MKKCIVVIVGIVLFCMGNASYAEDETLELTTYYPAPYGEYEDLYADRLAVGNVVLPTEAGVSMAVEGNIRITGTPEDDKDAVTVKYFNDNMGSSTVASGNIAANIDGGPNSGTDYVSYVEVDTGLDVVNAVIANGVWEGSHEAQVAEIWQIQMNKRNTAIGGTVSRIATGRDAQGWIRIVVHDKKFTSSHMHYIQWLASK